STSVPWRSNRIAAKAIPSGVVAWCKRLAVQPHCNRSLTSGSCRRSRRRSMRPLALVVIALAACTSSAAKQARQLYDRGDYAGAATVADRALKAEPKDDALWRVRV